MPTAALDRNLARPYRRPATPPDTPCRACPEPVRSRPRHGLCRRCCADPAVRARFAVAEADAGDFHGPAPLDPAPAAVRPGPRKVALLARRAARGLALFRVDEPTLRLDPRRLAELFGR